MNMNSAFLAALNKAISICTWTLHQLWSEQVEENYSDPKNFQAHRERRRKVKRVCISDVIAWK